MLLYEVETWTSKINTVNSWEAFEMWTYCRVLNILWTEETTNAEVLRRIIKDHKLIITIKRRKTVCPSHILCKI